MTKFFKLFTFIGISFLFFIYSITQAQDIADPQKFSEVKNQEVKFLFDTWKYHFGWKTLGGGYVRHILLITDESIVEIEMPEISNTPGYSSGAFFSVKEPIDIFLNILLYPPVEILPDPYEKKRQEIKNVLDSLKQNPSVKNFVNSISDLYSERGKKIKVQNIYFRSGIKDLKLENKGNEIQLSFKADSKKHSYISKYKDEKRANEVSLAISEALEVDGKIRKEIESQTPDFAKQAWYIEALGNGVVGSVNLDYRFHPNFTFRFGASYLIFGFGFPIMLNLLTGKETAHHLEFGVGIVPIVGGIDDKKFVSFETLTFGYRYQPKKGGFLFRISFTPLLNFPDKGETRPWGGISVGYVK